MELTNDLGLGEEQAPMAAGLSDLAKTFVAA